MNGRRLAVCTIGVVLALLLGGSGVDQGHAAGKDVVFIERLVAGESQGVLLDLAGATTWIINTKKYLFVSVPHTDLPWQPRVINPMNLGEKLAAPQSFTRRSLWYMPVGKKMLWGTLFNHDEGIALVFVERLTQDEYRISVEDLQGQKLAVASGILKRLDEATGRGLLEPKTSIVQEQVRCTGCRVRCTSFLWTLVCECTFDCEECVFEG